MYILSAFSVLRSVKSLSFSFSSLAIRITASFEPTKQVLNYCYCFTTKYFSIVIRLKSNQIRQCEASIMSPTQSDRTKATQPLWRLSFLAGYDVEFRQTLVNKKKFLFKLLPAHLLGCKCQLKVKATFQVWSI